MMRLHTKIIIIALVVLGCGALGLAQDTTPVPVFTPFPTPITDPYPFPNGLFCSDAEMGPGPTWRGITIGESTLQQLQALMVGLSDNYTFTDRGPRGVIFSLFSRKEALEKHIPSNLVACIENEVVVALSANDVEETPSLFLDDLIAELGTPDAVTWGNSSTSRVVFWFEEGIAVSVLIVEPFGAVIFPVYFPFQPVDGYESRWPFNRTRILPVQHHEGGTPPPSEQNPFDFDAILATITAQPSRTPTPTFVPYPTATSTPRP
jgi:hypothetical protein